VVRPLDKVVPPIELPEWDLPLPQRRLDMYEAFYEQNDKLEFDIPLDQIK